MSTTAMVERAFVVVYAVLRIGVVGQLVVAAVTYWARGELPVASGVAGVVALAWSVGYFVVVWRHRTFMALPTWLGVVDVAIAVGVLVVVGLALPRDWQIGSWHAWHYAYAAVVAPTIPAWLRSRTSSLVMAALIAGVYLAVVLPGNVAALSTAVINSVSFLVFTGASAVICPALRRVAGESDVNAARVVRLTGELEHARYQFHIHNATGLLARLARDDTPPDVLPALRTQALEESNRLRREALRPVVGSGIGDYATMTLSQVVTLAVRGFGHLPLEVRTSLAREVTLQRVEAVILQSALVSLLYNVQFHARATEVVVHADHDGPDWEVSVCDDGVGFDPERTPYGFGLQSQVMDATRRVGMTFTLRSRPGEGTCAVIRGRAQTPSSDIG